MKTNKILLINPSIKRPEQFTRKNKLVPVGIPLSIGYLSAYLAQNNMDFDIFDERLEPLHDWKLEKYIKEENISVVGISCTTPFIYRVFDIARTVKKISKGVKVILGGVHPSVMPNECLQNNDVDFVVRHEGEITLFEILKHIESGSEVCEVLGVSYKKNGRIIHNSNRPLIDDLDSLPDFPFHLFKHNKHRYIFRILTSRGCPYQCIFCSARSVSGRKYRYRSAKNVVNEIDTLINQVGIERISFADDTFTANKKRAIRLCELIIEKGFHKNVQYYCMARGDTIDRELLEVMKEAGFLGISFGIETGSNRIMKNIKKGETVEDNIRAVRIAKELGFKVRGSFILGFPSETFAESLKTIKVALKNPFDFAMFNLPIPFPGTELYEIATQEGNKYFDFSNFDAMEGFLKKKAVYVPTGRTERELIWLQRIAYFLFYFRFKQIINFLKIGLPELDLKTFNILEKLYMGLQIMARLFKKSENNSGTSIKKNSD
jgi:anaerobic magnesium-protoporphyrin IX monomethyl ester cyclase